MEDDKDKKKQWATHKVLAGKKPASEATLDDDGVEVVRDRKPPTQITSGEDALSNQN